MFPEWIGALKASLHCCPAIMSRNRPRMSPRTLPPPPKPALFREERHASHPIPSTNARPIIFVFPLARSPACLAAHFRSLARGPHRHPEARGRKIHTKSFQKGFSSIANLRSSQERNTLRNSGIAAQFSNHVTCLT